MSAKKSKKSALMAAAVVRMDRSGHYCVKVVRNGQGVAYLPMSTFMKELPAQKALADKFGISTWDLDTSKYVQQICEDVTANKLPRLVGISRLGWTDERDVFFYGETPYNVNPALAPKYEFIAPKSVVQAFQPHGSREKQYAAFKHWWQESWHFRLLLSLAAVSPLLEVMGAPTHQFHMYGVTGIGKTTMLRLAVSAWGDPAFMSLDSSKDTENYADGRLGTLHNFPLLLDETTLGHKGMIDRAYAIAAGHTKNRLSGPDHNYQPVDGIDYRLVCLMAGEQSIKTDFDHRGGVARLMEMHIDEPLVPKGKLSEWYPFASQHYGYVGQDLMLRAIQGHRDKVLDVCYWQYLRLTKEWCSDHSRTADFLAAVQIGHWLAGTVLGVDTGDSATQEFAHQVYECLNKASKLDEVLDVLADALPDLAKWVERGYIPPDEFANAGLFEKAGALTILRLSYKDLRTLLTGHGIVKPKTETRKPYGRGGVKCLIFTDEGKRRLGQPTHDAPGAKLYAS